MVEGTNLFTDNKGGRWKSALPHMARTISLLGPPPQELLDKTTATKDFFDKHGRLLSFVLCCIQLLARAALHPGKLRKGQQTEETSLEAEAKALESAEKEEFLRFLRRLLQWEAEKRPSARELLQDSWLIPSEDPDSDDG
jgi:serine/threonine-protein kinase SRPK3